jgi:hypothetical protein
MEFIINTSIDIPGGEKFRYQITCFQIELDNKIAILTIRVWEIRKRCHDLKGSPRYFL